MSNNNLINKSPYTSCVNFEGDFNLQNLSKLNEDKCHRVFREKQSEHPGIYNLTQFRDCECNIPKVVEVASQNPEVQFRDGYGMAPCNIDNDSIMRIGDTKKNPKCPIQLFTRPYATVPFMGRGSGNSYIESQLRPGEDTGERKQCNTLSGINIPNNDPTHMPMIDHLRNSIQDPIHIVQEEAMEGWVRGGAPSRQIVRDIEYLEKCGSEYQKRAVKKYM